MHSFVIYYSSARVGEAHSAIPALELTDLEAFRDKFNDHESGNTQTSVVLPGMPRIEKLNSESRDLIDSTCHSTVNEVPTSQDDIAEDVGGISNLESDVAGENLVHTGITISADSNGAATEGCICFRTKPANADEVMSSSENSPSDRSLNFQVRRAFVGSGTEGTQEGDCTVELLLDREAMPSSNLTAPARRVLVDIQNVLTEVIGKRSSEGAT